jgi:hypothetical protein
MNHFEIVSKLIGNIHPAGDASRDDERFKNLKAMCELANQLITEIDNVAYRNKDSHEFSVKRTAITRLK